LRTPATGREPRRTGRGDLVRAIELYDPHLIVHMTVATAAEIALLASSGKTAALNPRANANLGLPMPPVRALMESGANLLLGTDNGLLNSPNMFAELDFTYKLAKSQYGDALRPDPLAILRMATSNIRGVLGKDPVRLLEKGRPATFVVLDFHQPHLRATQHIPASVVTRVTPEDVLGTFRNGESPLPVGGLPSRLEPEMTTHAPPPSTAPAPATAGTGTTRPVLTLPRATRSRWR
jgi:cytosine/adenosine deaminase-related metal-dependent hydrolase